jgi:hypothetical protein
MSSVLLQVTIVMELICMHLSNLMMTIVLSFASMQIPNPIWVYNTMIVTSFNISMIVPMQVTISYVVPV